MMEDNDVAPQAVETGQHDGDDDDVTAEEINGPTDVDDNDTELVNAGGEDTTNQPALSLEGQDGGDDETTTLPPASSDTSIVELPGEEDESSENMHNADEYHSPDEKAVDEVLWQKAMAKHETQEELVNQLEGEEAANESHDYEGAGVLPKTVLNEDEVEDVYNDDTQSGKISNPDDEYHPQPGGNDIEEDLQAWLEATVTKHDTQEELEKHTETVLSSSPPDENEVDEVWRKAMAKHETQEELVNQLEGVARFQERGTREDEHEGHEDFENMLDSILNEDVVAYEDETQWEDIEKGTTVRSTTLQESGEGGDAVVTTTLREESGEVGDAIIATITAQSASMYPPAQKQSQNEPTNAASSDPAEIAEKGEVVNTLQSTNIAATTHAGGDEDAAGQQSLPWHKKHPGYVIIISLLLVISGLVATIVAALIVNENEAMSSSQNTNWWENVCPKFTGTLLEPVSTSYGWGTPKIGADDNTAIAFRRGEFHLLYNSNGSFAPAAILGRSSDDVSIAVSGNFAVKGSRFGKLKNSTRLQGYAQLFVNDPSEKQMWNTPFAPNDLNNDLGIGASFGESVDIDDDVMVVGAPRDRQGGVGSAYIYRHSVWDNGWVDEAKLAPDDLHLKDFGSHVAVKRNLVMVGDMRYGNTEERGAVFLYEFGVNWTSSGWSPNSWNEVQGASPLVNNDCARWFGNSLAFTEEGDLMIGCGKTKKSQNGAVYFYSRSNTDGYVLEQVISASSGSAKYFGAKISLNGDIMVVGSNNDAVYVFVQKNESWEEVAIINAPQDTRFFDVALSGNTILVSTFHNVNKYSLEDCSRVKEETMNPTREPTINAKEETMNPTGEPTIIAKEETMNSTGEPTIKPDDAVNQCFANRAELKFAVDQYINFDCSRNCRYNPDDCSNSECNLVTQMYGWPMNSWCVGNVADMSYLFSGIDTFNESISNWDVSKVTNMKAMFYGAKLFNGNISLWKTSSVNNMEFMFYDATSFSGNISLWDTSSVTNMGHMFMRARSFDVSMWNVSEVTSMQYMFYGARIFNSDISNWDVSKVSNMDSIFAFTNVFNVDISKWDVSKVTNMRGAFQKASSFNVNIGNWDISSVTNINGMFLYALSFNQDLCAWGDKFPYHLSTGNLYRHSVFTSSGCTFKGDPQLDQRGPFCASSCT